MGQGVSPKTGKQTTIIYKQTTDIKGGFTRMGNTARMEHMNMLMNNTTVHGYRLLFIILKIIDMNRGKSDIVCLTQKYIENTVLHEDYPSNKMGLYTGIKDLTNLDIIKKCPNAGRGFYKVNKLWFPIGSLTTQESF